MTRLGRNAGRSRRVAALVAAAFGVAAWRTHGSSFIPGPPARSLPSRGSPELETAASSLAATAAAAIFGSAPASAADAAGASTDWFQPFVDLNASIIAGIDGVVGSAGLAIIIYTIFIKLITTPLQLPALRASAILQMLSPQVELIKRKFSTDEDKKNRLLRNLYQRIGLNPVGSVLPVFLQLPIFIALFRSISQLAKQDEHFKESFLWIPSLAGPVTNGNPSLDWLLKCRFSDHFEPLVGWQDAGLYLILPVVIVASQLFLQRSQASSQESSEITTLFPVFIGISCLVSPSGLGIYWLINNLLTTAQITYVKAQVAEELPEYRKIKEIADAEAPEDGVRYTRDSPFMKENEEVARSAEDSKSQPATGKRAKRSEAKRR